MSISCPEGPLVSICSSTNTISPPTALIRWMSCNAPMTLRANRLSSQADDAFDLAGFDAPDRFAHPGPVLVSPGLVFVEVPCGRC